MIGKHRLRINPSLRVGIAALALLAALPSLAGAATLAPATRLNTGDKVLGPLAQSKPIHVVVSLKLRNEAQLDSFLANAHHAILTPAQFEQTYSPTPAQAAAAVDFLQLSGFTNVTVAANRLLVSADAPAGVVQAAFHTQLVSVHTHDGRNAFANSTAIEIPASLQTTVRSVVGLQTVHVMHSFARLAPQSSLHTLTVTGHDPTEFPAIYGASIDPAASGVTVGIVTEGSMTNVLNDINTFTSNNSLPAVTVQVVNTGTPSTDTSADAEWDLDSQDIVGMAGGQVGKLILYAMPSMSNSDLVADINTIVTADAAKIVNVSLGECETNNQSDGSAAAMDASFKQADAQGQTFSVAAGDSGADECGTGLTTPSYPASSPYVVALGGTTLSTSGTTWTGETVWSGTGGSPSTFEPIPSWQVGVGQNAGSSYRGVPDIAYDADPNSGALVYVDGSLTQVGGTSLAAPLFAGTWARVIQADGIDVGFAAPLLYQMGATSPSTHFNDIVSGNNNGETAAVGWDYCSGWGSMIVDQDIPPAGTGATIGTFENRSVSGTLVATGGSGALVTYTIVTSPGHGSVTLTNASTGAFTYTPYHGYHGPDSFTFRVSDTLGLNSAVVTEKVAVVPVPKALGGGGAFGLWGLLGLGLLACGGAYKRRR